MTVSLLHPPASVPTPAPIPGPMPSLVTELGQPEPLTGQVVLMSPGAVPEGAEVVGVLVRLTRPPVAQPVGQPPLGQPPLGQPAARPVVQPVRSVLPQFDAGKGHPRAISPALTIDDPARLVLAHGEPLELTRLEFDLLQYFADHPGRVLTRSNLLTAVWDRDPAWSSSRTVDVHVLRLRRALGPEHSRALQTVRGVGYRWVA